jgi:hypothetical protein
LHRVENGSRPPNNELNRKAIEDPELSGLFGLLNKALPGSQLCAAQHFDQVISKNALKLVFGVFGRFD